eukprot:g2296.t1
MSGGVVRAQPDRWKTYLKQRQAEKIEAQKREDDMESKRAAREASAAAAERKAKSLREEEEMRAKEKARRDRLYGRVAGPVSNIVDPAAVVAAAAKAKRERDKLDKENAAKSAMELTREKFEVAISATNCRTKLQPFLRRSMLETYKIDVSSESDQYTELVSATSGMKAQTKDPNRWRRYLVLRVMKPVEYVQFKGTVHMTVPRHEILAAGLSLPDRMSRPRRSWWNLFSRQLRLKIVPHAVSIDNWLSAEKTREQSRHGYNFDDPRGGSNDNSMHAHDEECIDMTMSSTQNVFAKFFPKTPPKRLRRKISIPFEEVSSRLKPKEDPTNNNANGIIMKIAKALRVVKHQTLGTETEQLTRSYKARLEAMPASQKKTGNENTDAHALPTMDYFDSKIMSLEPQRTLENAKEKMSQPITELVFRAIAIFKAASDAGVTGYSNTKMNSVLRVRLRQILDFDEEDPLTKGAVCNLDTEIPLTAPISDTAGYFNKLEFKQQQDSPIKSRLRAYFAKTYGVRNDAKKDYSFIPVVGVMEMTIEDIVKRAVDAIYKYQHLDRRAKKQLKGRFLDYLSNMQLIEIMTGNTLRMRCTQQLDGFSRVARGVQNEVEGEKINSEENAESKVDISCLMQPPVNMLEEDAWHLLSIIGLGPNGPIRNEKSNRNKKTAPPNSDRSCDSLTGKSHKVKCKTNQKKKSKKATERKSSPQKWSKRKKMRKLRELMDAKKAQERAKNELEYRRLHANTEAEEYKKRAKNIIRKTRAIERSHQLRLETAAISIDPDDLDQVATKIQGNMKSSDSIANLDTKSDINGQGQQIAKSVLADSKPLYLEHINDSDLEHINDSDLEFHREIGLENDSGEPEPAAEEESKVQNDKQFNDENYAEYDEDYDEYWDEGYEYDAHEEGVNKIEEQLYTLQTLYANKLDQNSKGLSANHGARVPVLPLGFISGSKGGIPSESKKLLDKKYPAVESVQNEEDSDVDTTKIEKEGNSEGDGVEKEENVEAKDSEYVNGEDKSNTEQKMYIQSG